MSRLRRINIFISFLVSKAIFILLLFAPLEAQANYIKLPDQFADQVADESTEIHMFLQGYLINRNHNSGYAYRTYSGFKFFIPPGTKEVLFNFTSTAIFHHGTAMYVASRFNAPPRATRKDFQELEQAGILPELSIEDNAARMQHLQTLKGHMGKRTAFNGEVIYIINFYKGEVLPPEFREEGVWVYVNLLDKNGGDSIKINSLFGQFHVDSKIYNEWRKERNFPSPEPAEPEFGFSVTNSTVNNAELNSEYFADIKFSNFDESKDISISGGNGQYRINNGEYTSQPGVVEPGQSVMVRLTSSSNYSRTEETTLVIGEKSGKFRVTTKPDPDGVEQEIYFFPNPKAGQNKNTWVESTSQVDVVVNASISISCEETQCQYKINDREYTSKTGSVRSGDMVQVRLMSSDSDGKTVRATLRIGSASGVFMVNTAPGSGGGGGSGPIGGDICEMFPNIPQCGGKTSPDPVPEPEKEIKIHAVLNGFGIQEVPADSRAEPVTLDLILELPAGWSGNNGQVLYMFGLLDIPGEGLFLAHRDIFGNIYLLPYFEGDPLMYFGLDFVNGQNTIHISPFSSLLNLELTAQDFADLGAVFYVAIIPDGDWDNYIGGSFRFADATVGSNPHALPLPVPGPSNDIDDQLPEHDPLIVEAGYLDFEHNIFEASDDNGFQTLRLDVRLPHGWQEMLAEELGDITPDEIDWSVYALIVCENSQDQQFLARSDILAMPRLIVFDSYTPIRPATWSKALSSGSGYIDLFPCIDALELTAADFAQLGLRFFVALVPDGDWDNYFGLHFNFEEVEE